jgi:TAT (twin-arginine translocation) pathway signal sequence
MPLDRRDFLKAGMAASAAMGLSQAASAQTGFAPRPGEWRRYAVTSRIEIASRNGKTQAWVPLPSVNEPDWFRSLGSEWTSNGAASVVLDPNYGAQMLHVAWTDATDDCVVEVTSRIATRDRAVDLAKPGTPLPLSSALRNCIGNGARSPIMTGITDDDASPITGRGTVGEAGGGLADGRRRPPTPTASRRARTHGRPRLARRGCREPGTGAAGTFFSCEGFVRNVRPMVAALGAQTFGRLARRREWFERQRWPSSTTLEIKRCRQSAADKRFLFPNFTSASDAQSGAVFLRSEARRHYYGLLVRSAVSFSSFPRRSPLSWQADVYIGLHVRADVADLADLIDSLDTVSLDTGRRVAFPDAFAQLSNLVQKAAS